MTETNKPEALEGFTTMLKSALGSRVNQEANGFIELMDIDAVMEFPYAPDSSLKKLMGRDELEKHMEMLSKIVEFQRMVLHQTHETQTPEVVILEFSCRGAAVKTGLPYNQDYISVITTRSGKIIHYRDYWNPLIALSAIGEADMQTDTKHTK